MDPSCSEYGAALIKEKAHVLDGVAKSGACKWRKKR